MFHLLDEDESVGLPALLPIRALSELKIAPRNQNMEFTLAVAASCRLPGSVPPLALNGLYDRGIRVQLVADGIRDNQRIESPFALTCIEFAISDATEQIKVGALGGL